MESLYYMPRAVGQSLLTSSAVICLVVRREGSLYHTAGNGIYLVLGRWGVSLTRPVRESVWSYVWQGVYVARPVLTSVSSFDCWGVFIARPGLESVSSLVGWGISLTRPVLVCLLSVCMNFSYSSRVGICRFVRRLGSLS